MQSSILFTLAICAMFNIVSFAVCVLCSLVSCIVLCLVPFCKSCIIMHFLQLCGDFYFASIYFLSTLESSIILYLLCDFVFYPILCYILCNSVFPSPCDLMLFSILCVLVSYAILCNLYLIHSVLSSAILVLYIKSIYDVVFCASVSFVYCANIL